jgi:hypothetical protein
LLQRKLTDVEQYVASFKNLKDSLTHKLLNFYVCAYKINENKCFGDSTMGFITCSIARVISPDTGGASDKEGPEVIASL